MNRANPSSLTPTSSFAFSPPSWKEIALVACALFSGIILFAAAAFVYTYSSKWVVAASIGGGGVLLDSSVFVGSILYFLFTRCHPSQTKPEIAESVPDLVLEKQTSHVHGIKHQREIICIKEKATALWYVKADQKDRKPRIISSLSDDYVGFLLSQNLGLDAVPETFFYSSITDAINEHFTTSHDIDLLNDLDGPVIVQKAIAPDPLKNPKLGDNDIDKQKRAKHVDVDLFSAQCVILLSMISGCYDCGGSRAENTVIGKNGRVYLVDNDLLGKRIIDNLTYKKEGEPRPDLTQHWLLTNIHVKDKSFFETLIDQVLRCDPDKLFQGVNDLLKKRKRRNIADNLLKIQSVFRECKEKSETITPSQLKDRLLT